jgi:hypothetical protein
MRCHHILRTTITHVPAEVSPVYPFAHGTTRASCFVRRRNLRRYVRLVIRYKAAYIQSRGFEAWLLQSRIEARGVVICRRNVPRNLGARLAPT